MYFKTLNASNSPAAHLANYYNHIACLGEYFIKRGAWLNNIDTYRDYDDRESAIREEARKFLTNIETNPAFASIEFTLEEIVADIWTTLLTLEPLGQTTPPKKVVWSAATF